MFLYINILNECNIKQADLINMAMSRYKYNRLHLEKKIDPIQPINHLLIDELINEQIYRDLLKEIASKYSNNKELEFYTDGSLYNIGTDNIKIGIGWIQTNIDASPASFISSIENFPSSTKAETMALLTALLVTPPKCKITICLDSNVTIQNYNKINREDLSCRKQLKMEHIWIWKTIKYIQEQLNLSIELIKIKGHSGNQLNDKADLLAKSAIDTLPISININKVPGMSIYYKYRTNIMDTSIKTLVSHSVKAQQFNEFLNLSRNKQIKIQTRNNEINWKYIFKSHRFFDNKEQSTTFKMSNYHSYKNHLIFQELLVIQHVSRANTLYINLKCPTYHNHNKD